MARNLLYAQAGGATAVLNASALGVIEAAQSHSGAGRVLVARNGILGVLHEDLIDVEAQDPEGLSALRYTPGAIFGTCRFDLSPPEQRPDQYERVRAVLHAHDIGGFLYNGGGGSMWSIRHLAEVADGQRLAWGCIGIPKTIDNDLAETDCSPGFGSAAKYIATSVREVACDIASMSDDAPRVFILEVMGRSTGWLAAAAALARRQAGDAPHLILFAEVAFMHGAFLERVQAAVQAHGYCVVVAAEGVRDEAGEPLGIAAGREIGGVQPGGVAPWLGQLVRQRLGYKVHWAVADYLQRAARHLASATDVAQAYAVGQAGVQAALEGRNGVMVTIQREADVPYQWRTGLAPLARVADIEEGVPKRFISKEGFDVTRAALDYLLPLIQGEHYPPYEDGLPAYAMASFAPIPRRLPPFQGLGGTAHMIKGVLLDLSGVLYVGGTVLPGAREALQRLQASGLPIRYVTNTSRSPRRRVYDKLCGMGFQVPEPHIFTAPLAVRRYLEAQRLTPYLLVHPDLEEELADLAGGAADAVVLGDAGGGFTYEALNQAFRALMEGAQLLATGNNRYFMEDDGLSLDVGPFVAALEYAATTRALILGKPAPGFFHAAVEELGCRPEEVMMVGDDAQADVAGALDAGLKAVLVRTGKYRPGDEGDITTPGALVREDISGAVDAILEAARHH